MVSIIDRLLEGNVLYLEEDNDLFLLPKVVIYLVVLRDLTSCNDDLADEKVLDLGYNTLISAGKVNGAITDYIKMDLDHQVFNRLLVRVELHQSDEPIFTGKRVFEPRRVVLVNY